MKSTPYTILSLPARPPRCREPAAPGVRSPEAGVAVFQPKTDIKAFPSSDQGSMGWIS